MTDPDLTTRIVDLEREIERLKAEQAELGGGAILQSLMGDIAKRRTVEAELRQAQEWIHLAQEAGGVAAYTYDYKTASLDWSPSTKALYGFPADQEPTLEAWLTAIHPADRDAVKNVADAALGQGKDVDHRFRVTGADGQTIWIQDRARVHFGADGSPDRLVGINVDVTELIELEQRAFENEQRLRLALMAERMACWDWDLATGDVTWDESLLRFAGLEGDFGGSFDAFWEMVHEDDRASLKSALNAAIEGSRDYDVTFRMNRPDGSVRWTQTRGIVVRDSDGVPVRMVGVDTDITDRFAADQQLRLFNSELHHRLKNNLATVQAMARTTLRNSRDMAAFEKSFTERLGSLAQTYDLLRDGGDRARLGDLIRAEVAPYAAADRRLVIDGPAVMLDADRAVAVGMIVHELTTNACKYGSLCTAGGELEVRWTITPCAHGSQVTLDWRERGAPPMTAPVRQGFGSKLLDRLVRQLKGTLHRDWTVYGLSLHMTLPLD